MSGEISGVSPNATSRSSARARSRTAPARMQCRGARLTKVAASVGCAQLVGDRFGPADHHPSRRPFRAGGVQHMRSSDWPVWVQHLRSETACGCLAGASTTVRLDRAVILSLDGMRMARPSLIVFPGDKPIRRPEPPIQVAALFLLMFTL